MLFGAGMQNPTEHPVLKTAFLTFNVLLVCLLCVCMSTQTASGCSLFVFLSQTCISASGSVADSSVLLNVNIVGESVNGCNGI